MAVVVTSVVVVQQAPPDWEAPNLQESDGYGYRHTVLLLDHHMPEHAPSGLGT